MSVSRSPGERRCAHALAEPLPLMVVTGPRSHTERGPVTATAGRPIAIT
ncbi:hypothetical protein [Streptomyces mirabilis]